MTKFLTALAVLLLPCAVQAMPVSHGQHGSFISISGVGPLCCIEMSFTEESSSITIFTHGGGQADANASFDQVSGFARVNGAFGKAVAEGFGQALLTITNSGPAAAYVEIMLGDFWSGLLGESGEGHPIPGPAALIGYPARDLAWWSSVVYVSNSADCAVAYYEDCALASGFRGSGPGIVADPDEAYSGPFFFGELGAGESISYWVNAYFHSEAVRVPEPGALALLLTGLGGLLTLRRRS